ncbi:hypothetical protein [Streptomyces sp. CoH17]|uniref:hypothetical protein n=1 Tax=Streptomyces sp. CoH17 TaxID=2992806 RepID=UPI00226D68FD|nr:hypothetical protein [Streptomyces sp. CoH17]
MKWKAQEGGKYRKSRKATKPCTICGTPVTKAQSLFRANGNVSCSPEHTVMLKLTGSRSSGIEREVFTALEPFGYEHTGDGKFFITGKDKRVRVPDFVKRSEKKVFEFWGDYWHRGEKPEELVAWYRDVGWQCTVVWQSELQDFWEKICYQLIVGEETCL